MDLPIACTLTPETIRTRRAKLLPGLVARAEQGEAVDQGYRFRFRADADTFGAITEVINAERQCCRFLRFHLTVEPDLGPLWLELTGPPGTRAFLEALLTG